MIRGPEINIKDIARLADVSVATVSHVINKNKYVSEELKERVEKVITENNYKPNLLAGSLRKNKSGTIGLVVPDSSNMITAEIGEKVERLIHKNKYNIIICNSSFERKKENENLQLLISKRVDGIIIMPEETDSSEIEAVQESQIPIVVIEREIEGAVVDTVLVDSFKAGYESAKHLIDLGHRRIGFIDRKFEKSHSIKRKDGYKKALQESGLSFDEKLVTKGGFTCESGFEAANYLMDLENPVTAILANGDLEALGVYKALSRMNMSIPEDVSVIGFDDMELCRYMTPSLTTIHFPVDEMVAKVIKLLMAKVNRPHIEKIKTEIVEPYLVVRESTGPVHKG